MTVLLNTRTRFFLKLSAFLLGILTVSACREQTPEVETLSMPAAVEDPRQLIKEICPKYGVPVPVGLAVARRESDFNPKARAFEERTKKYALRVQKRTGTRTAIKELMTSHGVMQVMGYNAIDYGVEISELYDPRQNVELGCAILGKKLGAQPKKYSTSRRVQGALHAFNGLTEQGARYAAEVLRDAEREALQLAFNW